jgi:predicted lactoylglutathione lyase
MTSISSIALEVSDATAAESFYAAAFGLGAPQLELRASQAPTSGFRGFTVSLIASQPADVEALLASALEAGASELKPMKKNLWGCGGVVSAPDGTIWKVATSKRRNAGPATREIKDIVLLLGVADVAASKRFYAEHGFEVAKSFGGRYAEFAAPSSAVKLALYGYRALAKDAGVQPEGTGSHRIVMRGDAAFTDPDGFGFEPAVADGAREARPTAQPANA